MVTKSPSSGPSIVLTRPDQILAVAPAVLRFVPTNSLVAIIFSQGSTPPALEVKFWIRCDITITPGQAARLPITCNLTAATAGGAILIAVCDQSRDKHARHILNTVRSALHRAGVRVHRLLMTHTLTQADQWVDPDTGRRGPTMPYTAVAINADAVRGSFCIQPSREHIEAEFALTKPAPVVDVTGVDDATLLAATARGLHCAIADQAPLSPNLAARAAIIVSRSPAIRDALFRLALGHERAAGQLWTCIAAQHRGLPRARLLVMAAAAYYCASDTVRAGTALDYAEKAAAAAQLPLPEIARLLSAAIRAGLPPSAFIKLIPTRDRSPIPGTNL